MPRSLAGLVCNLTELHLSDNRLTNLFGITGLRLLQYLDIRRNLIANIGELTEISKLPSLNQILLEGNPVCDDRTYRIFVWSRCSGRCIIAAEPTR